MPILCHLALFSKCIDSLELKSCMLFLFSYKILLIKHDTFTSVLKVTFTTFSYRNETALVLGGGVLRLLRTNFNAISQPLFLFCIFVPSSLVYGDISLSTLFTLYFLASGLQRSTSFFTSGMYGLTEFRIAWIRVQVLYPFPPLPLSFYIFFHFHLIPPILSLSFSYVNYFQYLTLSLLSHFCRKS